MRCKLKCISSACEGRRLAGSGRVQQPERREMRQHMGPLWAAGMRARCAWYSGLAPSATQP
jgi:hypothetical protein